MCILECVGALCNRSQNKKPVESCTLAHTTCHTLPYLDDTIMSKMSTKGKKCGEMLFHSLEIEAVTKEQTVLYSLTAQGKVSTSLTSCG